MDRLCPTVPERDVRGRPRRLLAGGTLLMELVMPGDFIVRAACFRVLRRLAMLVVATGACGAAACSSSSSGDRVDAGALDADAAADMTPAADVTTDTVADVMPEAAADSCVDSSPPNYPYTWAAGEQLVCASPPDTACSASSCAGGINMIRCMMNDTVWTYYYEPSGAVFAETESEPGGYWRYGHCSFNPDAVVCNGSVDAGCGSGDGQALDSGPDSFAD